MAELGFGGPGIHVPRLGIGGVSSSDIWLNNTGQTTLTGDIVCRNLFVGNGHIVNTAGYRIFCSEDCRVYNSGLIHNGGSNAVEGGYPDPGYGGAGGLGGVHKLVGGGSAGGAGGGAGVNVEPPLDGPEGTNGTNMAGIRLGGLGGAGAGVSTAEGGVGAFDLVSYGSDVQLTLSLLGGMFKNSTSPTNVDTIGFVRFGGGTGGGGGEGSYTAGGGGGGGGAGTVFIHANNIFVDDGSAITANGGNSGWGEAIDAGGGGGGGGGVIMLMASHVYLNGGAGSRLDVQGGIGVWGVGGVDGTNGSAGTVYVFSPFGTFRLVGGAMMNGITHPVIPAR